MGDIVLAALRALRENRMRSALAMVGVVIGTGSVVLLLAVGQGVREDIARQIQGLGANTAFILPGKLSPEEPPNFMSLMGISTLTEADVQSLSTLPGVQACVPIMFVFGIVEHRKAAHSGFVLAADGRIHTIRGGKLSEGRFYRADEESRRVCVLGHAVKRDVFGSRPADGQTLTIRGVPFSVVGALGPEETGFMPQMSFDRVVYLPFRAAREAFPGGQINRMLVEIDYRERPEPVLGQIRRTLAANHGGHEDFSILTQKQLLGALYRVFRIIGALLLSISATSLVVAGIGIMNIMLVTVTERTREIGIRRAVGARQRDLFLQFLAEAVILTVAGGAGGTGLAAAICAILARTSPLQPLVTPGVVALAFGVCFGVGVLFGVAPALRAARQNPIDALRWE